MEEQDCPNFGTHRLYIAGKTYTDFVPFHMPDEIDEVKVYSYGLDTSSIPTDLYIRNEYAVLSCQCGVVLRKLVETR